MRAKTCVCRAPADTVVGVFQRILLIIMAVSSPADWVVHKFGGSSVADADCFRRVASILDSWAPSRMGVVLSACKGVTDSLLALVSQAERRDAVWRDGLIALRQRHEHIATSLLTRAAVDAYLAGIDRDLQDLEGILQAVSLTRSASRNVTDLISGYGEIWSTRLFRDFYASSGKRSGEVRWLDAREVVVVEWGPLGPMVQWQESQRRIKAAIPAEFEER